MGDRVAGLPEGTSSGSIDFQNAFALARKGFYATVSLTSFCIWEFTVSGVMKKGVLRHWMVSCLAEAE